MDYNRLTSDASDDIPTVRGFSGRTFDTVAEVFYPIFVHTFGNLPWTKRFDDKLRAANLSTTANLWLAGSLGIGAVLGGLLALLFVLLAALGVLPLSTPQYGSGLHISQIPSLGFIGNVFSTLGILLGILLYSGIGATIGMIIGASIAIIYPYLEARRRARQIGLVLPDGVAFMHSLSVTGAGTIDLFRNVAESEDVYGEFAVEFQRIIAATDKFNRDFDTAVEEVARTTPNKDFEKFLNDTLATINAGGDLTLHFDEAKRRQRETRERKLEQITDLFRLLGQSYMTLTLFPMLLVIILVIGALVGNPNVNALIITVYFLIPVINIVWVFLISSVKVDDIGNRYIRLKDGTTPGKQSKSPFKFDVVEEYLGSHDVFSDIYRRKVELAFTRYFLQNPIGFFVSYPKYLFFVTVPIAALGWGVMYSLGLMATTYPELISEPVIQTAIWGFWPLFTLFGPYALFYEYREYQRSGLTDTLSEDFRSIANINSHGQPLAESLRIQASKSTSKLSQEFGTVYKKLTVMPMDRALAEMNNKYGIPSLSRQLKIVEKAQEVSTNIADVLETAAETAEYKQRIEANRQTRLTVQLVIVELAFVVFLLIMYGMDAAFIDFAADIVSGDGENQSEFASQFGGGFEVLEPGFLSLMFIHAALLQGFCSGILAGYIRSSTFSKGLKYGLINSLLVLLVWTLLPATISI